MTARRIPTSTPPAAGGATSSGTVPSGSRNGPGPVVGAYPGHQGELSTIELYWAGQLRDFPYDLGDPLDRAAFRALQTYASHLETLRVAEAGFAVPPNRRPLRLEQDLRRLRLWRRDDRELTTGERCGLAYSILETLFAPLSSAEAGREGLVVGKEFFDSGGVPRTRPAGEALPGVPEPDDRRRLDPVGCTAPLDLFYDGLAPLSAALRDALGEHVSQSDAARALGLTLRGVALKIRPGELRCLRIGGRVLIPREDVDRPQDAGGAGRSNAPGPAAAPTVLEALADALAGLQTAVGREAEGLLPRGALDEALRRSIARAREAGIKPPPGLEERLLRRGRRAATEHDEEAGSG